MGRFYASTTARTSDQEAVAEYLRVSGRAAYVLPPRGGVTVICGRACDRQDEEGIADLTAALSGRFDCAAWSVLNHDDDVLIYWLCVGGRQVDHYSSWPGYFGGRGRKPKGGDAASLCAAFGAEGHEPEIEAALRRKYTFEFERHEHLRQGLGLADVDAAIGYGRMATDGLADSGWEGEEAAVLHVLEEGGEPPLAEGEPEPLELPPNHILSADTVALLGAAQLAQARQQMGARAAGLPCGALYVSGGELPDSADTIASSASMPGLAPGRLRIPIEPTEYQARPRRGEMGSSVYGDFRGGSLCPLEVKIQTLGDPTEEERTALEAWLFQWHAWGQQGIAGEGPLGSMGEVRWGRRTLYTAVDWGEAGQRTLDYLLFRCCEFDRKVAPVRGLLTGPEGGEVASSGVVWGGVLRASAASTWFYSGPTRARWERIVADGEAKRGEYALPILLLGVSQGDVATALAELDLAAFVSPAMDGRVVVWEREAAELWYWARLTTARLSQRLHCPAAGLTWARTDFFVDGGGLHR